MRPLFLKLIKLGYKRKESTVRVNVRGVEISMVCDNITVNGKGHLCFDGQDTVELAQKYGTPVYLMDEDRIRYNCRVYRRAMEKYFGGESMALYASKAASFAKIYSIVSEEGLGADVVSSGEIYTAMAAGFDMSKAFFCSVKAKHVVRAVISMAHGMNLKVVAEGIETETEAGEMYVEGIDYIQGYYYSRPLPPGTFMEFLKTGTYLANCERDTPENETEL